MQKKPGKKPSLSPEAAKILEQYRTAGKTGGSNNGGADSSEDSNAARPPSAPPPQQVRQRSGTRGK